MQSLTTPARRRRPKRRKPGVTPTTEPYYSKAIGRALDVLECFTDQRPVLSLKEISHLTALPESSLFRVLVTLEARGYLLQNADGSYQLSPRVLFGRLYERAQRLREIAHPYLQRLASRFDETASLAYLFEDKIQVLDTVESLHIIRFTNKPGRVLPPHCSSLGKAITAYQPPDVAERILEAYGLYRRTERSIVDRDVLTAEFEQIRRTGYACDREESVPGGVCLGAAVRSGESRVVAAVSVSIPVVRLTAEREAEIVDAVREAGRQIAEAVARPAARA